MEAPNRHHSTDLARCAEITELAKDPHAPSWVRGVDATMTRVDKRYAARLGARGYVVVGPIRPATATLDDLAAALTRLDTARHTIAQAAFEALKAAGFSGAQALAWYVGHGVSEADGTRIIAGKILEAREAGGPR